MISVLFVWNGLQQRFYDREDMRTVKVSYSSSSTIHRFSQYAAFYVIFFIVAWKGGGEVKGMVV